VKNKLSLSDALSEAARILREAEVTFDADKCLAIKIRADGSGKLQYNLPDSTWELNSNPEIDEFEEEFADPSEIKDVMIAAFEMIYADRAEQEKMFREDAEDFENNLRQDQSHKENNDDFIGI